MAADLALLRLELRLERSFDADQPRVPAGQPGGGRWISNGDVDPATTGSIGGTPADDAPSPKAPETEQAVAGDGSRVLTIRIRARPRPFDEQSTVVAPDGESRIVETSGATQTIRDGDTGEVLGRSTFTPEGVIAEPTVQPAFLPAVPLIGVGIGVARTLQLLGILFAVQSARNDRSGTAVLGLSANEYRTDGALDQNPAAWVGRIDQTTLDAACPRNGEVLTMTDQVAAEVRQSGLYRSPQDFGNKVHARIAQIVKEMDNPNFRAELSLLPERIDAFYGQRGTLRLDLLERTVPGTACIYDYKTGVRGIEPARALDLVKIVKKNFPETTRIIVIQVRPRE
ncbi:hypothetical protein [Methylobacterium sp. sgz302541]|uniref:hypothetical protein n=1 Tax=Methylobacterium sp. sgz302541 TaxID=3418177 RepID=UPI003D3570AD